MATVRKTFVYDPKQDNDIHDWINGIKIRERSKYIRIAIRSLLSSEGHVMNESINSNNTERISFTYDDLEDRDIHLWFEGLPQRGQSDYIKRAIRVFISSNDQAPKSRTILPSKDTNINNDVDPIVSSDTEKKHIESQEDYVDLNNDFLDNIGK